ncbi:unnamed protein product [Dicrocoelium dendriticum]|nr:unnamed protein product [Dicrocoelium dendriticum]
MTKGKAITEQPTAVIVSTSLGPNSQHFLCSICLNKVVTTVHYVNGPCTWLACTGIALIGGFLGCCLIPFFVNTCKDAKHMCPTSSDLPASSQQPQPHLRSTFRQLPPSPLTDQLVKWRDAWNFCGTTEAPELFGPQPKHSCKLIPRHRI